jgi:hypothetical protein
MIEHDVELRRHVECIVRPIRGSASRKVRMREELLVHLTSIFDEELAAHDGDVIATISAAIALFGDPAALGGELQTTVPWVERVLCAPLHPSNHRLARHPGESVQAFLRRLGPSCTGVNAVTWSLFALFILVAGNRRPDRAAGISAAPFLRAGPC